MIPVLLRTTRTLTSTIISPWNQCMRFAGGGGRPGGKPTFNWKEKKILRLDLKKKKRELKNTGKIPEEELHEVFNSDGALFREIKMDEDFDSTTFFPAVENLKFNDKKVIDVTKLYGSSKPRMAIIRKHTGKSRFSHRRIFGKKFADAAQE